MNSRYDSEAIYLKEISSNVRRKIFHLANSDKSSGSHFGGALSAVEILTVLYLKFLDENSRFILSKGHSALVLYSILNQVGLINDKELESYHKFKSSLLGHPVKNRKLGIEFSTGSLGMGLSLANGLAYLKKVNNSLGSVFCLLGDGEINEGSVWESIQFAAHHSLSQLICLIDNNGYQQTGSLTEISNSGNILEKFQSFKWHVTYIDGHDTTQLANAISAAVNSQTGLPNAIVCQTVKGKGVKDMENNNKWHHSLLSVTQYEIFKESIY